MSFTKSFFIGLGVVLLSVGLIAMMLATKPKPPKKPVEDTSLLVEVILPEPEDVTFQIKAQGIVLPRTETTLVSEVSGVVQSVSDKFVAGGVFAKGEVLLSIDPTDYQVGVEQAKARLASEQAKYAQEKARAEQARKEWDLTGRSRENAPVLALREPFLLEAKANMQSAEADLKKAEQKLARTTIRAPYDGMVKGKQVDIGQFVATGTQLGTTFAVDYAEVRLPLTDQEMAFINVPGFGKALKGEMPEVVLSANYAGSLRHWQAKLVRMEGVVDQQSRVHYAVARISDPYSALDTHLHDVPLKIGTFVEAQISGKQEKNLVKLPRDTFRDLSKVLVSDKNNELHSRQLEVVRSEGDYVYVRSGLETGDRVVTTTIESPVQGMKVRIFGDPEPELEIDENDSEEVYAQKN